MVSFRIAGAVLSALLVAGCASNGDASPPGQVSTSNPAQTDSAVPRPGQSFSEWLAGVRTEALRQGVSARTLDTAFAKVRILDRVLELDSSQPEFSRPIWSYLDSAVSDTRVQQGRAKLAESKSLLAKVSAEYGAPPEILVAFWGIESDYGRDFGDWSVVSALATLAYKSRRPAYFRGELLAALRILDSGDISLERMRGSWAGAMGQTQFMPTIFLKHAVDYNGDRKRDIWDNLPDVFASTAHFVVKGNGWRTGESWGEEVRVNADFPWDQAELTVQKPIAEWVALGVRPVRGTKLADYGTASIIAPAGHSGPVFLVRENFRSIMRYNPSTSYALAVALLADRMKGGGQIAQSWPRGEAVLSRSEREELQQRLATIGFNPGSTDSLIGPATRTAIRGFQKTINETPDGFPTKALLDKLRKRSEGKA
ncbi:MAG: lytic murein transglycosylase [Rhodospirillaceae bacterium]